ncbi:ABC transporter ATP-binding protein [Oceanobacillus neutriphilus]|uniref:ABC transporter ATP-binding protein n=1 Tax=Oceanobacillus neutriphilus TaxID=531815 RepID=A0ABQ2NRH4_9BACI|nr:ABC transporter ATP-binding protein [Oceanobacillus neutriphilus]GGP09996.1 ABC transporter ATP-binding protein [Oceanobacillus neutriphilus]
MSLFTMDNVRKTFAHGEVKEEILKGINISLSQGKITALTGASGSGKSTLLTIAAGLQTASDGQISFEQQELTSMRSEELRQIRAKDFGFIFQFAHLVPFLTVQEQLDLMLDTAESPLSKQTQKKEIKQVLELVGMWKRKDAYPASLSGGEKQRVAVARAIIHSPKVLFADEPTASLDSKRSQEVMKLIQNLSKERHITVLMVTHDMDMLDFVDEVIEMRDGKIVDKKNT